jgi:hypothetical protein
MNVREINPDSSIRLSTYVISAVVFTILTAWGIVALQSKYILRGRGVWTRFLWPYTLAMKLYQEWKTGVPII